MKTKLLLVAAAGCAASIQPMGPAFAQPQNNHTYTEQTYKYGRYPYANYGYKTEVLVASVRSPLHVLETIRIGAHVATLPFKVIHQLVKHPLTDVGLARFLADAAKIPGAKPKS